MKKIIQNIIPFKGFAAMAIFPFIFIRKDWYEKVSAGRLHTVLNHEKIHFRQQLELLLIGFYLLYLVFWIFYGYKGIPFEKEAYANAKDSDYLIKRKPFAWVKYIWRK